MTPTETTLASSPADDDLATTDSCETSAEDNIPQTSASPRRLQRWLLLRSSKNDLPRTLVPDELALMVQERNGHALQEHGGIVGLAHHLNTSLHNGMHDDSLFIQKRREEFGANIFPGPSPKGFFSFLSHACNDPPVFIIFMVWAVHSLVSGVKIHGVKEGWYEGAAIAAAAILMILVTSFTDYWQGLQFLKLDKSMEKCNILVDVARGGKRMKIPMFDLVVGDITFLKIGDQVPADGLFVQGHSVCLDESTMTGESDSVNVNRVMPFLLAGCKVIEGSGKMLVTGVGLKTAWGRLMVEHKEEDAREKTPLQLCFDDVTAFAGQFSCAVAVLGFVISLIIDFVGHKEDSNNLGKFKAGHGMVLTTIVAGLVLTQGLRLAITLSLTYAVQRMMVDRAEMGDEFNDVSTLNEANIGLSRGMEGTEAAEKSSNIIILDDNFASVVHVVRWGRSIYLNMQKCIQFQLTVNVCALSVNVVAAVSVGHLPLTAAQLLWVNLIMDTLGVLALATDPPTDEELRGPPVQRKEPLISNIVIRNVCVQALYQVVILLTLQLKGKDILRLEGPDATNINTIIVFNAFVLCQLFNEVNTRKLEDRNILKGLSNNRRFVGIICSSLALQVIVVELLSKFASTVKLSWQHWLICIVIGFFSLPVALLGKLIPVPKKSLCSAWVGPIFTTNRQANAAGR